MATSPLPIDLAAAIADLTPIDWPALEADAIDDAQRAGLHRLRLLDGIVRACAVVVGPGDADASRTTEDDRPPATWGRFTIHERVGRGTFGDVYRAHDRRLDRIVALKLLRPGRDGGDALASEAIHEGRLLARVRHPNVVTVHGAERIDQRVGVWMEFVDGRTLAEEIRDAGPLAPAEVVTIGLTLCGALTAVHAAGLLHRDLKAQNVMRASDGRILLTDFGAGHVPADVRGDARPELAGTPLYLAPEVLTGRPASVASEVYGLGVLLYHLATGAFPVRGRTLRELRQAHASGERVSVTAYRDKLPVRLVAAIDRAIDPEPAKRFASIQDMAAALARCAPRRQPWAVLALSGVAIAIVVALILLLRPASSITVTRTRIVPRVSSTPDMGIAFIRGDRLYFTEGNSLFKTTLNSTAPAERVSSAWKGYTIADVDAGEEEYLALGLANDDAEHEVWIATISSGHLRPVGSARCQTAAWSPDAARIACMRRGESLSIISSDGKSSTRLPVPDHHAIGQPRWSPDGTRLRFNASENDRELITSTIWEVRADGTDLHQVLPGWNTPPGLGAGAWTPDGEYYIFTAESRQTGVVDLWAIREHRHWWEWRAPSPVRLTSGALSHTGVFLSQDGSEIITAVSNPRSELATLNATTHRFEPYLGGLSGVWTAFSPDRSSMVYIGYPLKRLWRSDHGGTPYRLIDAPVEMDGVMWSPDGKWLSFVSRLAGMHRRIFLSNPDGTNPQPITGKDEEQGIASWSPDSTQIAFGDVPPKFGVPEGPERLHIYNLQTRTVTDVPGSEGLWTCRWSPDGRYLAALTIELHRNQSLMLLDMSTGVWRAIPAAEHINTPIWSHDSTYLYYDVENGPHHIRRVRISDGRVELVADMTTYATSPMWAGLTEDDSPIVPRNIGTAEIYALTLLRK